MKNNEIDWIIISEIIALSLTFISMIGTLYMNERIKKTNKN